MLGPVMLDLAGIELTAAERETLQHPQVGGVILFTRNYQSLEQLQQLLRQIRAASHTRLIVAVDHEGGRVQRFRADFTPLPAAGKIGQLYQTAPEQSIVMATQAGWLMAAELLACDIDLSFAPMLDIDNHNNPLIGDRSFHQDPQAIITLAGAYMKGMQHAGMQSVGKHFPGHGSVTADSHNAIPVDPRAYETIMAEDGLPFAELIKAGLAGIMPAHIIYSAVDPKPAGFSAFWLQTVLRQRLNFQGAIFSDDLGMTGASTEGDIVARSESALAAGCDGILICNDYSNACKALEHLERLPARTDPLRAQRLTKFVSHSSAFTRQELFKSTAWQKAIRHLFSRPVS
jgi:beta-N-acetylhexosaminidase